MAASVGEGSGGTTNWGLSFSYDVYGNRTAQTVTAGSAPAFSASFGSNNRMVGYSYDNNGNQLTTPDGATLEYDPDNRLTKWTKQGQTDQYQYHPSGWRLSKGSEKYLYGPGGQLLESYRAWNDITDYVYFGGRLLYTLSAGQAVTRVFSDRLGSTRVTETIQPFGGGWTTRNYYPFGEEITSTSNDDYKFASTYRDSATGLDYAVNRYYASGMGRFDTADPLSGGKAQPEHFAGLTLTGNDDSPVAHRLPLIFGAHPSPTPRIRGISQFGRPGSRGPSVPLSWNRYIYATDDPVGSVDSLGLDDTPTDPGGGDPSSGVPPDPGSDPTQNPLVGSNGQPMPPPGGSTTVNMPSCAPFTPISGILTGCGGGVQYTWWADYAWTWWAGLKWLDMVEVVIVYSMIQ